MTFEWFEHSAIAYECPLFGGWVALFARRYRSDENSWSPSIDGYAKIIHLKCVPSIKKAKRYAERAVVKWLELVDSDHEFVWTDCNDLVDYSHCCILDGMFSVSVSKRHRSTDDKYTASINGHTKHLEFSKLFSSSKKAKRFAEVGVVRLLERWKEEVRSNETVCVQRRPRS